MNNIIIPCSYLGKMILNANLPPHVASRISVLGGHRDAEVMKEFMEQRNIVTVREL